MKLYLFNVLKLFLIILFRVFQQLKLRSPISCKRIKLINPNKHGLVLNFLHLDEVENRISGNTEIPWVDTDLFKTLGYSQSN